MNCPKCEQKITVTWYKGCPQTMDSPAEMPEITDWSCGCELTDEQVQQLEENYEEDER